MACLAEDCVSMAELEGELQNLEDQIAKIRAEAKRRFLKAGIPN
jgi:polyhydroxyalkanoate synthesis regulator phasin